jgi:hypothetical protein
MSEDNMMNATSISSLPAPMTTNISSEQKTGGGTTYSDLIKDLDINKMKQSQPSAVSSPGPMQSAFTPAPTPSLFPPAPMQNQRNPTQTAPMPQQGTMDMPASIMMQQMMPQQQNVMQTMQQQNSMYGGAMPQSAPISQYIPTDDVDVQQTPLNSTLLPDPMFFQPPPPPPRRRRKEVVKAVVPEKKPFGFDASKVKPAILVAAIVFALLSYGAPLLARRLEWSVDSVTGKFTSAGLVTLSILTGGIFLGISELIRNFGNGMN